MPSQWQGGVRPASIVPVPVIVGGSRSIGGMYYKTIRNYLDKRVEDFPDIELFVGDAKGADYLAEKWADRYWYVRHIFRADWEEHGKAAGPIRNKEMVKAASRLHEETIAVFFMMKGKDTPGTLNCIELAGKYLGWDRVFIKRLT